MEKIERRKVTEAGPNAGFRFTLPFIWCRDMRLRGGDYVEIWREGDRLILIAEKERYGGGKDGGEKSK
jgi:hypothetical protein